MPDFSVALGTFDGVHLGHRAVLESTLKKGLIPIALTFDLPPKFGSKQNLLMTPIDKTKALSTLGISAEVMDFEKIKDTPPNEFLTFIKEKFSPKIIATGYNFRFGKSALGTTNDIAEFCKINNIEYICANAVKVGGEAVSSTRIRKLIADGEVNLAGKMLGQHFFFSGEITHGDARGRTIGFPTLNIPYPTELVIPKFGVYASLTEVNGKIYKSVTDIGVRPTFKTDYIISETNIMGFEGDLYGKIAKIHLVDFIRGEVKFGGVEELKFAISKDKKTAAQILKNF